MPQRRPFKVHRFHKNEMIKPQPQPTLYHPMVMTIYENFVWDVARTTNSSCSSLCEFERVMLDNGRIHIIPDRLSPEMPIPPVPIIGEVYDSALQLLDGHVQDDQPSPGLEAMFAEISNRLWSQRNVLNAQLAQLGRLQTEIAHLTERCRSDPFSKTSSARTIARVIGNDLTYRKFQSYCTPPPSAPVPTAPAKRRRLDPMPDSDVSKVQKTSHDSSSGEEAVEPTTPRMSLLLEELFSGVLSCPDQPILYNG